MDKNEVCANLCYYDKRNPDGYYSDDNEWLWAEDDEIILPRLDTCYCDNCFYGRDDLALEIIKLLDLVQ